MSDCQKIKYHNKNRALNYLNRMRKWGMIIPKNASAYLCPFCNHWHLGHNKFYKEKEAI